MKITKARLKEIIQEELGNLDREEMTEDDRPFRDQMTRDEYEATRGLGGRIKDAAKEAGDFASITARQAQMVAGAPILAAAEKFKEDILPHLKDAGIASVLGGASIILPVLVKAGLIDPKHLGTKGPPVDFYGGLMSGEPLMGKHKWAYRAENPPEEEL